MYINNLLVRYLYLSFMVTRMRKLASVAMVISVWLKNIITFWKAPALLRYARRVR